MSLSAWQRIAVFTLGLVAVFGLALGVGRLVGPIAADEDEHDTTHDAAADQHADHHAEQHAEQPGDQHGAARGEQHELALDRASVPSGSGRVGFRILDASGEPVTSYDVVHEKRLHLIAVRRDLAEFRHVHPRLDAATGRWTVPVTLEPGPWRLYADFAPAGGEQTLAEADLDVTGDYRPRPLGPDTDTARVDGYEVHLAREDSGLVAFHVTRGGREVTDLQPYLGAYGHLVAIAAGDLTYLHVHPEDGEAGPEVAFHAELAEPGRYRLFLDFRHAGKVRTAAFTVTTDGPGGPGDPGDGDPGDGDSGGTPHDHGGGHEH